MSIALHNKDLKLLPPDTFLSPQNAQKCVGGAYSAPPDPLAGKGGRAPREGGGRGRKGRGRGEGGGWRESGRAIPPNGNPGYGPVSFHCLHASERIQFKLAVIIYRALHGTAPQYLSDLLRHVADISSRRCLRSSLHFAKRHHICPVDASVSS